MKAVLVSLGMVGVLFLSACSGVLGLDAVGYKTAEGDAGGDASGEDAADGAVKAEAASLPNEAEIGDGATPDVLDALDATPDAALGAEVGNPADAADASDAVPDTSILCGQSEGSPCCDVGDAGIDPPCANDPTLACAGGACVSCGGAGQPACYPPCGHQGQPCCYTGVARECLDTALTCRSSPGASTGYLCNP